MDIQAELAFQFANELTNQLITLSTAIIAFTTTFTRDVLKSVRTYLIWLLVAAWVMYLLSVICGILSSMALTGALASGVELSDLKNTSGQWIGENARLLSACQIISFLIATVITIVFGTISLIRESR